MVTPQNEHTQTQENRVDAYEPIGACLRYPAANVNVSFGVKIDPVDTRAKSDQSQSLSSTEKRKEILDELKKNPPLQRAFDRVQAEWLNVGDRANDINSDSDLLDPATILDRLGNAQGEEQCSLICEAELTRFTPEQRQRLLPILWYFILGHRNSNIYGDLVAVGSAIRKYVAMMDVTQIGNLSTLLESGHRVALPPDLVLEVAKMVYRKFEANPPAQRDPEPVMARQLAEIVRLYLNPRLFPYGLHATTAMLSTQALAVMLSQEGTEVIIQLNASPYRWFKVQLHRRLLNALESWRARNVPMADSLSQLLSEISTE